MLTFQLKGKKFHEEGSFKKGHSDHGHHIIKKGEEDEKKTKFFDEDGDEAHDEKEGLYNWMDSMNINQNSK